MCFIVLSFLFSIVSCHRYSRRRGSPSNDKPQFDVGDWWADTNGEFIQGHGGNIEFIDNYDCFNNGTKGCWVWHGEDKTDGTTGVHCYASTNLYVWEDKGFSLYIHDLMPQKINAVGNALITDIDNLKELKRRANLPKTGKRMRTSRHRITAKPTYKDEEISDSDIDQARNFLKPYVTEIDKDGKYVKYDEPNLLTGFLYLYKTFSIIERPKMLYNKKYNNYVLIFHYDGPLDSDVIQWIHNGMPSNYPYGKYYRAMLGFAVSDSPFGPYKVVNVQRMHYVEGWYDQDRGIARDMGTYVDRNEEESDVDEIAYVIYSSENNEYLYMSRLDDTYTTVAKVQGEAKDGYEFKARVLGDSTWREAPALFRHKGYYYLMTSGTTGWSPNAATYHRSTMLFGPYEPMGNPCEGSGSDRTFDSQSTYFIRYNPKKGQFIYFGDRWFADSLYQSRYVLLPCEIDEEHKFHLHYTEHWSLEDVFGSDSDSEK